MSRRFEVDDRIGSQILAARNRESRNAQLDLARAKTRFDLGEGLALEFGFESQNLRDANRKIHIRALDGLACDARELHRGIVGVCPDRQDAIGLDRVWDRRRDLFEVLGAGGRRCRLSGCGLGPTAG